MKNEYEVGGLRPDTKCIFFLLYIYFSLIIFFFRVDHGGLKSIFFWPLKLFLFPYNFFFSRCPSDILAFYFFAFKIIFLLEKFFFLVRQGGFETMSFFYISVLTED